MCDTTLERWKLWIQEVNKLTGDGMAAVRAFKVVARRHGVSCETIKRAYYRPPNDNQIGEKMNSNYDA